MPFDSNGTFNRLHNWQSDAAAQIKIRADRHDEEDDNFASGLSGTITKDGKTQPTANLPMNQKKLTNLGEPTEPTDAVTKNYVDNIKSFATGMIVTGANWPNGMIYFAATTGVTGLSFASSDMCWASKPAEAGKWSGRIVAINKADGTGAEIVTIDKSGVIGNNSGWYTQNLSHDGTNWRTNTAGMGTVMGLSNGSFSLSSNDTATVQANQIATMNDFFSVDQNTITHNSNGSSSLSLNKKDGTSGVSSHIWGNTGSQGRWRMDMGNGTSEAGGGYNGSDFYMYAADNAGANWKAMFALHRNDNHAQFWGDVYTTTGAFRSNYTNAIMSAQGGAVILRPHGADNGTHQVYANADGYLHLNCSFTIDAHTTYGVLAGLGVRNKNGIYGGFGGNWQNFLWANSYVYALVDNTNVGAIQMVCDYRTKRNIRELPSTWEAVRKLHPIRYQYKAPANLATEYDDDEERWGFTAHELQETLTPHAASFRKDEKNALQSPNLMVIVAALTKALQEAQDRIEALEAKSA
ncbi:MAG: tail fiber domain-containing protein [Tardiphaga sp.]